MKASRHSGTPDCRARSRHASLTRLMTPSRSRIAISVESEARTALFSCSPAPTARARVATDARERVFEGGNLFVRSVPHRIGGEIGDRLLVRQLILDRELRAAAAFPLHQQQRDQPGLECDQPERQEDREAVALPD